MAKTDKKTLDLINEVKKQKAEIAKLDKPNWRTTCSFSYVEFNISNSINIHVESNVGNLVKIAAFLQHGEKSYVETAKGDRGLKVENLPPFTWQGFSLDDWMEDIKTRICKIQIATKRKKLEVLETRLNAIISPELRAELELEEITKELK